MTAIAGTLTDNGMAAAVRQAVLAHPIERPERPTVCRRPWCCDPVAVAEPELRLCDMHLRTYRAGPASSEAYLADIARAQAIRAGQARGQRGRRPNRPNLKGNR